MPEMSSCRRCGTPINSHTPFGHCAKCLLELGLESVPPESNNPSPAPGIEGPSFGDYEILARIGRGGMGIVYKARQKSLHRLVAIKMIRAEEFASPAIERRFQLEAEAAANLEHPNIVPIYEVGEHEGHHYYSMKLIEGNSLEKHITTAGFRLSDAQTAPARPISHEDQVVMGKLMTTVARAVHYAHQHGVLHRDIKPSNILLDAQGQPYLTDFGIAKVSQLNTSNMTLSGMILGTPSYMAPEQASGQSKHATTAADVYSLGAILYEMLTGRPPFRADTPLETMKQVAERPPVPPTTLNKLLDRDLTTICLKCLEKEPKRRYASAEAMAEDLEHWLRGEPIQARLVSSAEKAWRWCRRNPALSMAEAAVFLLLIAVAILSSLLAYQAERRANQLAAKVVKDFREFWEEGGRSPAQVDSDERRIIFRLRSLPSNSRPVRFGVYTHQNPEQMFTNFSGILTYLEDGLNTPIDLRIYKGYSNAIAALVGGDIDVMRPGPASYVLARQQDPGIILLAKQLHNGKPLIHGVIFTHTKTGITNLAGLKGQTFAFGDRDSTFGNYVAKQTLMRAAVYAQDLSNCCAHLPSHSDVVDKVAKREFAAGAANLNIVSKAMAKGDPLRILAPMQSISFPWVARSHLPSNLVAIIKSALLRASSDPEMLKSIAPDLDGFEEATPAEYDPTALVIAQAQQFEQP